LIEAMGVTDPRPEPADWVRNWIDAEATRPWPPEMAPPKLGQPNLDSWTPVEP
jgi:hypothetical protein